MKKIDNRTRLADQNFYNSDTKETFQHVEVILDEGCTCFGQLPHKPYTKKIPVMFDYGLQAWIRIESY